MIEPAADRAPASSGPAVYSERLRTPWWWYPAGVVVGVLLGAEFVFVLPDSLAWVPIVVSVLAAIAVVWRISAGRVGVRDGAVLAGDRRLPVAEIEQTYPLSGTELRRVVGRHGNPLAFTFVRSWVGPGVQLVLRPEPATAAEGQAGAEGQEPPALREPYWLVSSRHPDRLLAAVQAAREHSAREQDQKRG